MWSEKGPACLPSAGRAFNITQVPPGGVKCSFPSFPHTLQLAPFAWKSDGDEESCQKGGAYQWSPQTDSFLRKQHTSYGNYLFICFVHVLFQTYNVHHQPPEWVPEIRKKKKKTQKNINWMHMEKPSFYPRPHRLCTPAPSLYHTLMVLTAPFFQGS